MTTFALHGYERVIPALEFGPLQAAFEQRGFPCRIIRSPKVPTKTPMQDRAKVILEAHPIAALGDIQASSLPTVVTH